jgi:hypothetical protein
MTQDKYDKLLSLSDKDKDELLLFIELLAVTKPENRQKIIRELKREKARKELYGDKNG